MSSGEEDFATTPEVAGNQISSGAEDLATTPEVAGNEIRQWRGRPRHDAGRLLAMK